MGFFMMDYYVPSILIVVISWVSFWLHQDASAPRILLGKISILLTHTTHILSVIYWIIIFFKHIKFIHSMIFNISWRESRNLRFIFLSGTNTILTFMTLASKVGNSLPKVSYIKASEIWFLGCTIFLFSAMVEFAFVNTIYRRKYVIFFVKFSFFFF